nr:MAG TPA: hypothetical protein [Caudoviricetes sp.]
MRYLLRSALILLSTHSFLLSKVFSSGPIVQFINLFHSSS